MTTNTSDRQPLLPTHVNRSQSSRLTTPRISFPSASTSALDPDGDTSTLVGSSSSFQPKASGAGSVTATQMEGGKKPGLPKLSRECLISEIKCYGSYMLPPLLVFGVLVIGVSLLAVGWKSGWFRRVFIPCQLV